MNLFTMMVMLLEEVEKQTGNFPIKEKMEEKATYLLEHSIVEYNTDEFLLTSYSQIGIKESSPY